MVTGGVLYDLNENFVRSWEKIPMGISSKKEAEEFVRQRREIKRSVFKPDKTKGTVLNAQILCTQPEFGLEEIKGFYYRLSELSTSYLYIENQYFPWPPLAEKLAKWGQKMAEQGREDRLCVFVVTNTSKEGLGKPFFFVQRASLSLLGVVWPLICPSSSTSMAWCCLLPAV